MATERTHTPRTKKPVRRVGNPSLNAPEVSTMTQEEHLEITELVKQCFSLNAQMNNAKKAYEARREDLLKKLVSHKREKFRVVDGNIAYVATVSTPIRNEIDVEKLRGLVTEEVFMACVKATIGDVQSLAGKNIATDASVPKKGTTNVSVKTEAAV